MEDGAPKKRDILVKLSTENLAKKVFLVLWQCSENHFGRRLEKILDPPLRPIKIS